MSAETYRAGIEAGIAEKLSNAEIGERLGLAERTIKNYRTRLGIGGGVSRTERRRLADAVDRERFEAAYADDSLSLGDLARMFGLANDEQARTVARTFELPKRSSRPKRKHGLSPWEISRAERALAEPCRTSCGTCGRSWDGTLAETRQAYRAHECVPVAAVA